VPQVLKTCIASGTTLVAAENQVRNLRLNPDIGELRIALGIPTGGGWTMSGTTSQYVGTEIDVMISSHSIQLPLNTIDTYKFAASLYFDVFMVAPNLQVHATLNVGVNAQNQHPAVLSVGRPNCGTRMKITW
jgi:hypothetical protein